MMCLFSLDSGAMYADLNISLVNDGENKNSRTKAVSGAMAVGGMGKGEIKVRCLNLEPPPIDPILFPEKQKQGLLCTLAKDPIINAEYN